MKEIRNTHEQARALYTEIPEIIHTNISFCQDLYKLQQGKGEPYEIQIQKSNHLIRPKQKPYPRQRYFHPFLVQK